MKIHISYRNPTPSHCEAVLFINGANAGTLTLRQDELIDFQHIIFFGASRGDELIVDGDPEFKEKD